MKNSRKDYTCLRQPAYKYRKQISKAFFVSALSFLSPNMGCVQGKFKFQNCQIKLKDVALLENLTDVNLT